jgi:hypothetical protein
MPSSVTRDVARFIQANLPKWLSIDTEAPQGGRPRPGMISMRDAAKQLRINSTSVQNAIKYGRGIGSHFETIIADLKFGGDVTKLRKIAKKWADEHPEPQALQVDVVEEKSRWVDRPERYAAMEEARRDAVKYFDVDPEFAKHWEVQLRSDEEPDVRYLVDRLVADWKLHKRQMSSAQNVLEKGNPLEDLDELSEFWRRKR